MSLGRAVRDLERELRHWPEYELAEIQQGENSHHGPTQPKGGTYTLNGHWFCIVKTHSGPQYRDHYQGDGKTPTEAVAALTAELRSRRTQPHRWHVEDWMQEGRFVIGCTDCEKDAAELFDGKVEWSAA